MPALTPRPITFHDDSYAGVLELHADELAAELTVQVAPGPITLTVTGEGADTIHATRRGTTVRVTGGPAGAGNNLHITSLQGDAVFIAGGVVAGSIYVNGVRITTDAAELPRVHVTVPEGTPVTLTELRGTAHVGSTRANLAVVLTGHGEVTAGAVAALGARVTGSGDVTVARVDGTVTAAVAGSGDVRIDSGHAPTASLSVAGSGDITFGGTADTAALSVAGSGDIYLAHVVNPPAQQRAGSGRIRVGQIGGRA